MEQLSPPAPRLPLTDRSIPVVADTHVDGERDHLEQLEAGMTLYDAFYRWCRDATGETHNWPTNKAKP